MMTNRKPQEGEIWHYKDDVMDNDYVISDIRKNERDKDVCMITVLGKPWVNNMNYEMHHFEKPAWSLKIAMPVETEVTETQPVTKIVIEI
jgi:hypothetical protein